MIKIKNIPLSISVASIIFTIPTLSLAQYIELADISITATKTEVATSESPASISVVNEKKLENKSVQRVDKALDDIAGVYVRSDNDNTPSSWNNTVILRGIPQYYRTAVLVDGVAINNSFSGGVNWSNIPVDDIQQIEVVKGPFSSLYGGNAMGGVINVITKKPTEQEIFIRTGYGSNNYKNLSIVHRNKLTENIGISLNYDNKSSDGYIQDLVVKTTTTGVGGTAVSGAIPTTTSTGAKAYIVGDKGEKSWKQQNFGAKIYYDIDDNQELIFGYTYHTHETEFNHFNTYLTDAVGNPVYSGSVQLDPTSKSTLSESNFLFGPNGEDVSKYTLGYKNYISDVISLKIDTGYNDYRYWYISTGATATSGAGKYTDLPNEKTYVSAQMDFAITDNNLLVVGVDLNKNELHKQVNTLSNWTDENTKTALRYKSEGRSTTKAIFLQDTINVTDKIVTYLGGRYDLWETDGFVNDVDNTVTTTYNTREESQFSPKLSVVYLSSKDTTFRTSIGKAFRAPSLSDLYSDWYSGATLYKADPALKPESVTSWEIGFEHKFSTNTFLKSTYYENYLTDLMYSTVVSPTLNEKRNAGKAEIKGIEIEINQNINDNINIFANYTYNKTEITENISNPALVGNEITYSPKHQYNIGLNAKVGKWSGSLIGKYVDYLTTKDDNTDVVKDVSGSYEEHLTVDTKINYEIKKGIKASLAINNMFDKEYYQSSLTPGRTVYAELAFKF